VRKVEGQPAFDVAGPGDASVQARLDDVQRRLNEHPGYREYRACEELARTINAVFVPNLDELFALLTQPTQDQQLAIELFQNVRRPDVREAFHAQVTQRLHNYVAGSTTLIDHARNLMRPRTGRIAEEFDRRKTEVAATPEVAFVRDLRNFVLHQANPFLGHTVRIMGADGPIVGELELTSANLLTWGRWKAPARAFIRTQPESFTLRPIICQHGGLMVTLHNWLHNELAKANAAALEEANQLVVERNAILGGIDPVAAERLTETVTKLRNSPTPIKTDDLPDALGSQSSPSTSGD
jgi:hypothetical protein